MAWVERRGSALMQNRVGPNRIGPLGLFQSLADGIKFIFKEDPIPGHVDKFYYAGADHLGDPGVHDVRGDSVRERRSRSAATRSTFKSRT